MKKLDQNLSDVFDIEPLDAVQISQEIVPINNPVVSDDADFARTNIRELINSGNSALNNLLTVAKESEAPRAYEVAATLIKNLSDLNKDLMEIQKRKQDLTGETTKNKNINVDKAVFVGSTTELVKFLKNNKQET
jgi:Terminase DNA packaging enzyme